MVGEAARPETVGQRRGVSTLSNTELLSVALTGKGKDEAVQHIDTLFKTYSLDQLLHADFGELANGLGETKAAQLQAILEMARRLTLPSDEERYTISSPRDAAEYVRGEMEHLDHEEMRVLLLDIKNHVTGNLLLYQGTVNSSVLRNAEIFRAAVARKSAGIVLCHNHPSGDPDPSPEDLMITEQLVESGKLLDVEFVDHIIIGKNQSFTSLKERMRW